ncbi:MAG: FadR family transcriptional regulator [Anaerolineae bacterium]|nr:FadR family transcriptional regulator [Anaerolineae bacterium]
MNVSRNTLVEKVTHELRHLIKGGDIAPGEFLPSRKELAARFGVGVSTVHEAVQALTAVGLVESHPGKGTWVREDALETLIHPAAVETRLGTLQARQVCEARAIIEVSLTEMAARRATADDVARIWVALDEMEASMEDDEAFVQADVAFHIAVAQAGHNELLEQFYHLSHKLLAKTIGEFVRLPKVKEEAVIIQRTIAQAIKDHDPVQARHAALEHKGIIEDLLELAKANERG